MFFFVCRPNKRLNGDSIFLSKPKLYMKNGSGWYNVFKLWFNTTADVANIQACIPIQCLLYEFLIEHIYDAVQHSMNCISSLFFLRFNAMHQFASKSGSFFISDASCLQTTKDWKSMNYLKIIQRSSAHTQILIYTVTVNNLISHNKIECFHFE